MKKIVLSLAMLLFLTININAQNTPERIKKLEIQLDSLSASVPGLSKPVDFSINATELNTFIRAIAASNGVNVSLDANLKNIIVSQSFSDATVKNVLLNLCKEYSLTIEVLGNILAIKKYHAPFVSRDIPVFYNADKDLFSADLQQDSLSAATRKITQVTGKNVVFSVGLGNQQVSAFIKDMPFDAAIHKIALVNQLMITKTKDNFYLFEKLPANGIVRRNGRIRKGNFHFKVKDTINQILEVDFVDTPIEAVISDIAYDLKVNMATSKPLRNIGKATIKSDNITFNDLLNNLLEDTKFTYKLEDNMYFFGESKLASVVDVEVIQLMNRAIESMMQPIESTDGFSNDPLPNTFSADGSYTSNFNQNRNRNFSTGNNNTARRNNNQKQFRFNSDEEVLSRIFPEGVTDSLKIKVDLEQNSFIVRGAAQRIEKFKKFVKKIDREIPLVMIEVMIIEVNKSSSVSAGIELGIGDKPTTDGGTLFSGTNVTLGANSINRIIQGLGGAESLNIGRVVPNFYAKIHAMETNGDLKIKSTPRLTALNGHVASMSNGQRTYYTQTLVNTFGTQNPQTSEFTNYIPIDANLSIKIRPIVSGDGKITLSIDVMQSSFSSEPTDEGAPPNIDTRRFNSTLKVRDKDVVVLGGLEVNSKSNSGSGVPFLARIPVIKWLFSKRVRTASNAKLSVLIRPTVVK